MMIRSIKFASAAVPVSLATLHAAEIGHFSPGVLSIRDFAMPEPGYYGALYNYAYTSDRLNDAGGNRVNSVTINPGPGPGVTLGVDVNVDLYAIAPTFIWVSPWKILDAKYGAYIAPTFANTSVGASLATETGSARSADESQFGAGDLFVQPFWLGWAKEHWDLSLAYGFYAPVGRYDTDTVTLGGFGPVKVEAADNIGLGYWTHQIQSGLSWYPWADKRLAVATALTYEIHGDKEDFDLRPGQNLTLNWGVSQYIPLGEGQCYMLEVGPTGYSSWQVTDDSGSDAALSPVRDQVHAAGLQLGLTYLPWNAAVIFRWVKEFSVEDRFQGESFGLNFGMKF